MRIVARIVWSCLLLPPLAPAACFATALAAGSQAPRLVAENAWIRAAPGSQSAAAYLRLRNVSSAAVTVTAVSSPVASHVMVHESTVQAGQSRMRPRPQLLIAAGQTVELRPGGLHVMLEGLSQPLTVGQSVPLIITSADGSSLRVMASVRPLTAE